MSSIYLNVDGRRTQLKAGCIVDGYVGQYLTNEFVQWAIDLGFHVPESDMGAVKRTAMGAQDGPEPLGECDDDYEVLTDISDDAETWVNAHLIGGFVSFHNGEVFIVSYDDPEWETL